MTRREEANAIVKNYVLWSVGGGLIPIPLADLAAVTALQVNMLERLAELYDVDYSHARGKTFVTALTGSTLAKVGASLFKIIPGVGTIIGGVAMSATSGASTYAVGRVAMTHFEASGTFENIDLSQAKRAYEQAFEEGKEVVSEMEKEKEKEQQTVEEEDQSSEEILQALEKLGELREKGVLTEEEFERQKEKLLERL